MMLAVDITWRGDR